MTKGDNRLGLRAAAAGAVPASELPRERLVRDGAAAMKDCELLAIMLGTGYNGCSVIDVARAILREYPAGHLAQMSCDQLRRLKGLGSAKAASLAAAFELARRALGQGMGLLPIIRNPSEAVALLTDIADQPKEHFMCLYLNARNQVSHKEVISIGSLSASIVHPREVYHLAVRHCAASIILAHNHPSGDVSPSREDLELTRRLAEAGEIMGVEVLDHIIVAAADYLSLKGSKLMC